MVGWQQKSSWPEAGAALERAKGRLGDGGSADLRRRLDQGARDLDLVANWNRSAWTAGGTGGKTGSARADAAYEAAFREAGMARMDEAPEVASAGSGPPTPGCRSWPPSTSGPASPSMPIAATGCRAWRGGPTGRRRPGEAAGTRRTGSCARPRRVDGHLCGSL